MPAQPSSQFVLHRRLCKVPRYAGNPLDPPLRSRFQAFSVPPLSLSSRIDILSREAPTLPLETVKLLASAAEAFRHADLGMHSIRDLPKYAHVCIVTESFSELLAKPIEFTEENLISAARILEKFPRSSVQVFLMDEACVLITVPHHRIQEVLHRVYPYRWVAKDSTQSGAIELALKKLGIDMKLDTKTRDHSPDVQIDSSDRFHKKFILR